MYLCRFSNLKFMFSKIKRYILRKKIAERMHPADRVVMSLDKANNVGMVCEITDEDSYKAIFRIFSGLQQKGKNVHLIGYINEKFVPFYCLQQLSADYFCNKQLNWYGEPNMVQVQDFINEEFDILLDFNYRYHVPVDFILSTSAARFVIGSCKEYADVYDLLLQTEIGNYTQFINSVSVYTRKLSGNE